MDYNELRIEIQTFDEFITIGSDAMNMGING